ncbi:RpiR family transcriptional regulator [Clostridium thermosuccinogenes]|jgi:DNA-binding MurR/RpiR family transcriptional regulator|uniref:RpiR family transcriptional regulator n=1 Tax=Clostridium thermosuccinogenes TaxID=84032 RepID=A0A2K2F9G1_9CLOT|nr:MurR/RpiR family transcriptional regulator [Pseudoclostridium thermosuccinogenes]AUS95568.1 RpiR family transcriptional regulator [Pseudoclostridium thermosuccinogenes]PNT90428.1 RpiR family transcriptional regulator [Pseudoclostridium thermosuccinogenes]PNT94801.1 RpiR family transcriptional regulator [Pseudoclostridium thermosuccinogenes]PNT95429.1 RpiR family transcriptional regulator [Pseudoclostridium thermosuccinogenes]
MPGLMLKIKESLKDMSLSERKVANYILNNTEEAVGLFIGELAERCGTSKASVIRMCRTLNYDGYREFALALASDVASEKEDDGAYTDIRAGDDLETIIKNVCHNSKKSIDDTYKVLNSKDVERAINIIHKARRILFFGAGASGLIALDAQQKFIRINKCAWAYTDQHMQATSAANLSKNDVVVVISYSGETADIIESVKIAKESGATIISITKYGNSTLSEISDINLFLSSPETMMRSGAMGSRIAQLTIIDIIFTGVASLEYPYIKKYLDRTKLVTSKKRSKK